MPDPDPAKLRRTMVKENAAALTEAAADLIGAVERGEALGSVRIVALLASLVHDIADDVTLLATRAGHEAPAIARAARGEL